MSSATRRYRRQSSVLNTIKQASCCAYSIPTLPRARRCSTSVTIGEGSRAEYLRCNSSFARVFGDIAHDLTRRPTRANVLDAGLPFSAMVSRMPSRRRGRPVKFARGMHGRRTECSGKFVIY